MITDPAIYLSTTCLYEHAQSNSFSPLRTDFRCATDHTHKMPPLGHKGYFTHIHTKGLLYTLISIQKGHTHISIQKGHTHISIQKGYTLISIQKGYTLIHTKGLHTHIHTKGLHTHIHTSTNKSTSSLTSGVPMRR